MFPRDQRRSNSRYRQTTAIRATQEPPTATSTAAIRYDRFTSKRDVASNVSNAQRAAIRRRRGRGLKSTRSGPPVCFQRRSNALMSTWGMAVVRDFRTAARAAPLAADERPVAVAPHGQPAAVAPHRTTGGGGGAWTTGAVAAHGQPAAVAHGRQAAAVAHGRQAAVAPHEQLGEVGEPMVAAAGHGRSAPLGKARER